MTFKMFIHTIRFLSKVPDTITDSLKNDNLPVIVIVVVADFVEGESGVETKPTSRNKTQL